MDESRSAPAALLNERQVAQLLGCSLAKIRHDRAFKRGVRYVKISRLVRYRSGDVAAYIANLPAHGGEEPK